MARARDNRDGTISILDDDGNETAKFEKTSGDQISGEGRGPGGRLSTGKRGGRGDLDDIEGAIGGSRDDASRVPQTPDTTGLAGDTDSGERRRLQEEYAIALAAGTQDENFINIRLALRRTGLTQAEANDALMQVSNNPASFSRTTPPGSVPGERDQGRSPQEQQQLLEQVRGQQLTGIDPATGIDVTTSAAPPGSVSGIDVTFGNANAGDFSSVLGSLDREQDFSLSSSGRNQLFNEYVANIAQGAGGAAPYIENFASRLRQPLSTLFNFGPLAQLQGSDPSGVPRFNEYLSGIGSSFLGNIGSQFKTTIQDVLGLNASQQGNPITENSIQSFFEQDPNQAFNLGFGAQNISPFSPFADVFQRNAQRNFTAGIGRGGDPFDYLRGASGGATGFGSFFG